MLCPYMHLQKKQKNRKSNDEEDGDKQKKAKLIIDNEKQDPFQFASVWLWSSRCFSNPYILNKHETGSFLILDYFQIWGV